MATLHMPVSSADHIQGGADASITLVEYGDYECPHCAHAHPIVKLVQKHFGERLRFVFRNFPLREMHPHAEPAAESAEYAGAYKRFWEMHDSLFENQDSLGLSLLLELAESLDLSADNLRVALETRQYAPRVREDFLGGVRSGVNGTPTFFINGARYDGAPEFENMVEAIEELL